MDQTHNSKKRKGDEIDTCGPRVEFDKVQVDNVTKDILTVSILLIQESYIIDTNALFLCLD